MKRSVEGISGNIEKFTTEELRQIKKVIEDEISKRNLQKEHSSLESRLYFKLCGRWLEKDYEEELKSLTIYTEEEFLQWSNIGKRTLEFAKSELQKRGLSFKAN